MRCLWWFVVLNEGATGTSEFMYSDDGVSWTASGASLPSGGWVGIGYGDGHYVADEKNSDVVAWSTDGLSWTEDSRRTGYRQPGVHMTGHRNFARLGQTAHLPILHSSGFYHRKYIRHYSGNTLDS